MIDIIEVYRVVSGIDTKVASIASDDAILANGIMNKNEVLVTVVTDTIPDIQEGDFIRVSGIKYKINRAPEFDDKSSVNHTTTYLFEAPEYTLIDKILTNKITKSVRVTLTGKLRDWLDLLIWNVNKTNDNPLGVDTGWKLGNIPDTEYMTLSFDGIDCRSLLSELASAYGYEYYVHDHTINYVSRIENERNLTFTQGQGGGLYEVEQSNVDSGDVTTRVYPVGGTKNMTPGEGDEEGRLMLPEKYLENFSETNRVVEKKIIFDGIYPSFTGFVDNPTGENYREFICRDIDFNIKELAIGDNARINFLTGDLMGKSFEFKWDNSKKKITLIYQEDELVPIDPEIQSRPFIPSATKHLKGGEKFNFTGIRLGESYKQAAILKLREKATDWLAFNSQKRVKFTLDVDYRYMRKKGELKCGDLITISIPSRNVNRIIRITSTERNLKTGKVSCVVSNYLTEKWADKIEGQISSMQATINGGGVNSNFTILEKIDEREPTDKNVFSALRVLYELLKNNDELKKIFLRKDQPDQASFLLSFLAGAVFGKDGFASGLTGFGAKIDEKGNGEMRGLRLWEWLEVPELRFNRVEVYAGIKWRTPGVGIIESVEIDTDSEGKLLSTGTVHLKLEAGEMGAVAVDDISMGIIHFDDGTLNATKDSDDSKGNFRFAGFGTAYFRITGVSGQDNGTFRYSLRPGTTLHPQKYMHFSCYGNFTNPDRQTSVYETRTYSRMLRNQNTWEMSAANIAMQSGDLSNLNVHGLDMTGYSMYLNSVYFTGTVRQMKPDGTPVYTANDRGAWIPKTKYDFYDRVSHDGSIWLCVNEKGSSSEPSEGNADWLKQVNKGEDGKDGDSVSNHGQWQTGMHIPYLGIVKMGTATWMCTVPAGTDNPPMWTITDKDGNRLLQTQDGGKTYGYILTGTENSTEYIMIAQDGTDGIPGEPGKDGKVLYTWIRYADDAQGNGISDSPIGKKFLGLAHNKETSVESNDPEDYQWSDIKGEDGIGTPGNDGKTYYTWVAYSDNADGSGMYQQPNDTTKYIGIAVNKETATESTDPAHYTWSKFKGEDGKQGDSVSNHGQWQTGKHIPYLGIVRMGNATWLCTVPAGTDNPPMWTVTDKDGNRLLQTQDGGKTYGYILTGELNTAEYELVARDGTDGESIKGDPGIQGCIIRKGEWKIGEQWRNDESLTSGTRYLDVALVRDDQVATGWKAYKCKTTHTSSLANAPGNSTYWEEFGLNTTAIFTSLIIAKDAQIDFMQGNQLIIKKDDGTVTAGLSGTQSGEKIRMWAGSPTPDDAPFRVTEDGKVHAENAEITGEVNATSGVFKNIRSPNGAFRILDNGNIEIIGKVSTSSDGTRIVVDPNTNSIKIYNQDNNEVGDISFLVEEWAGTTNYYPRLRLKRYSGAKEVGRIDISASSLSAYSILGANTNYFDLSPNGLVFSVNGKVTKEYPNR
jgi:hypothetical protein